MTSSEHKPFMRLEEGRTKSTKIKKGPAHPRPPKPQGLKPKEIKPNTKK